MYFIGVDLALINSGFVVLDEKGKVIEALNFKNELPEGVQGKDTPDWIKQHEQSNIFRTHMRKHILNDTVGMTLFEGASYGSANSQGVSIGGIHGIYLDFMQINNLNFAILSPNSIKYAHFGKAKEVTKRDVINLMKEKYPDLKLRDSNIADALMMAELARKFYYLLNGGIELTKHEKYVFLTEQKEKGEKKGLIFKQNKRFKIYTNTNLIKGEN